jgi:cardiolipin synthase
MRPTRAGLVGGTAYLLLTLAWLLAARPPEALALLGWALAVGVFGVFLTGAANQVTLARAYLAGPALIYSTVHGGLRLLALSVALAGLSDLVDGTIARRFGTPTRLGGALDPVVDGIFFGAVAIGLALGAAYPLWLAAVVVGRYALPALAGAMVLGLLHRSPELRHTLFGQLSTALIAVLLGGVALFRGLGQDSRQLVVAAELVIPLSTLAVFANLYWSNRAVLGGSAPGPDG